MTLLHVYLVGAFCMLAYNLGRTLIGYRSGQLSLEWSSPEGGRRIALLLFHGMAGSAAIWPFTLAMMLTGVQGASVRVREAQRLKLPDDMNAQCESVELAVATFLNVTYGATQTHALAVAFPLVRLAWFQAWHEARTQGLSNDDARVNFLGIAKACSETSPYAGCSSEKP